VSELQIHSHQVVSTTSTSCSTSFFGLCRISSKWERNEKHSIGIFSIGIDRIDVIWKFERVLFEVLKIAKLLFMEAFVPGNIGSTFVRGRSNREAKASITKLRHLRLRIFSIFTGQNNDPISVVLISGAALHYVFVSSFQRTSDKK
jgi:hypothetical protein